MAEQSAAERDAVERGQMSPETAGRGEAPQPDPLLQATTSRVSPSGLTLLAVIIIIILGVVLYGLNSGAASNPPPAAAAGGGTSGAPTPNAPRSASHSPG
jgi:hypothetical protein